MWSRETPRTEEFLMSVENDPKNCKLYWPGHHVHWIHARHAWQSDGYPATDVFVHNNWIHFTSGGVRYSRWNHIAWTIPQNLAKLPDATFVFYKGWRILAMDTLAGGAERRFFNLDTEPSECGDRRETT